MLAWLWRKLHPEFEAPVVVPTITIGEGETPEDVFYEAAARFLDVQITTNIALDTKSATTLSVGSTVLPVSFGLLNLGPNEVPSGAAILLIAAVAAYIFLLSMVWRASLIRAMDFRPDMNTLEKHSEEYEGSILRRWVAREYRKSTEANTDNLENKARWVGAANLALFAESLLLSIAAILTLL